MLFSSNKKQESNSETVKRDIKIIEPKIQPIGEKTIIKRLILKLNKVDNKEEVSLEIKIDNKNNKKIKVIGESEKYLKVPTLESMAYYIYWPYGEELIPYYTIMINYLVKISIKRGYNYFSIQRIDVSDKLKNEISKRNIEFLESILEQSIKKTILKQKFDQNIYLRTEEIYNDITKDIFENNGGFFIIIKHKSKKQKINII